MKKQSLIVTHRYTIHKNHKIKYSNFWSTLSHCVMLVHQSLWLKSSIAVNSSVVHLGKIIFFKAANISVSLLCILSSTYLDRMIWIHFLSLKRILL